jgi:hypothetical protein
MRISRAKLDDEECLRIAQHILAALRDAGINAEIVMDVDAPPIIPDEGAQGHGVPGSSRRNP